MSGKIAGKVWDLDLPHAEAWVLMCMADHADHNGDNVRPLVDLVAWKTGYSVRSVQRYLAKLRTRGILIETKAALRGRAAEYRIELSGAPLKPKRGDNSMSPQPLSNEVTAVAPQPQSRGDKLSRQPGDWGDKSSTVGVTKSDFEVTESHERTGVYKEEPSIQPSCEPSEREKRLAPSRQADGQEMAPSLKAYGEFYENFWLSVVQQEAILAAMTDPVEARECFKYCALNGVKHHSIGRMIEIYQRGDYKPRSRDPAPQKTSKESADEFIRKYPDGNIHRC